MRDDLFLEVQSEFERATSLHKSMASLHEAYAVLLEEVDEFWDLVKKNPKKMSLEEQNTWRDHLHEELIQIAAMAVRAVHDNAL